MKNFEATHQVIGHYIDGNLCTWGKPTPVDKHNRIICRRSDEDRWVSPLGHTRFEVEALETAPLEPEWVPTHRIFGRYVALGHYCKDRVPVPCVIGDYGILLNESGDIIGSPYPDFVRQVAWCSPDNQNILVIEEIV